MLQFLASNTLNTPKITRNKQVLYGIKGEGGHHFATGMTDEPPLQCQMPNLSPQHWLDKSTRPKAHVS